MAKKTKLEGITGENGARGRALGIGMTDDESAADHEKDEEVAITRETTGETWIAMGGGGRGVEIEAQAEIGNTRDEVC